MTDGLPGSAPAWSLGDYPCREEGFAPGDRCSDTSCGEAAARAEPTTWETVESVRRFEDCIATVEALLDGGRL